MQLFQQNQLIVPIKSDKLFIGKHSVFFENNYHLPNKVVLLVSISSKNTSIENNG